MGFVHIVAGCFDNFVRQRVRNIHWTWNLSAIIFSKGKRGIFLTNLLFVMSSCLHMLIKASSSIHFQWYVWYLRKDRRCGQEGRRVRFGGKLWRTRAHVQHASCCHNRRYLRRHFMGHGQYSVFLLFVLRIQQSRDWVVFGLLGEK